MTALLVVGCWLLLMDGQTMRSGLLFQATASSRALEGLGLWVALGSALVPHAGASVNDITDCNIGLDSLHSSRSGTEIVLSDGVNPGSTSVNDEAPPEELEEPPSPSPSRCAHRRLLPPSAREVDGPHRVRSLIVGSRIALITS